MSSTKMSTCSSGVKPVALIVHQLALVLLRHDVARLQRVEARTAAEAGAAISTASRGA